LEALYGASEASRVIHAGTEAIIALALVLALKEEVKDRLKVSRQLRGLSLLLRLAKHGPRDEKVRDPADEGDLPGP
jgi:hypothetical protein